jgi:hypothetical protein
VVYVKVTIVFGIPLDADDAPRRVQPYAGYWAFNYAAAALEDRLRTAMLVLAVLVLYHDLREPRASGRSCTGLRRHLQQMEKLILEVPSVVTPITLELARPFMQLPDWIFWVVCTEMIMSARLFQEGKVFGMATESIPRALACCCCRSHDGMDPTYCSLCPRCAGSCAWWRRRHPMWSRW